MTLEATTFGGQTGVRLDGPGSTLFVSVSVGPRILELRGAGPNMLASVPDAVLERPDGVPFRLLGGHRLWAAPEVPSITYEPDDRPCDVTEIPGGVRVRAEADGAGLAKAIEIRAEGDAWVLDHELRNASVEPMTVAPWAITQLRPGGAAALPLGGRGAGPQADRSIVLWPYTDPDDPRLRFLADLVTVEASPGAGPVKVGAAPGDGSIGYRLGSEVFEKRADVDPSLPYADHGAAAQVYVRHDFCELESLGPLVTLSPGDAAVHRETWTLREVAT